MSIERNASTKAFGVEEGFAPYRLRQARYYELGVDCAQWARQHFEATRQKYELLDIGTYDGVTRRYVEIHPGSEHVKYHAVDIFPQGKEFVYKHQDWQLHHIDLTKGLPGLKSNSYDVVVCEQVLEHLHDPAVAIHAMHRVLRPGGRMILGVPIFPEGMHLLRKHVVPVVDRITKAKPRGHVQAWSKRTFVNLIKKTCPDLKIETARGFRIISGGLLRPLESYRWWWQLNRRIGATLPSLCVEVQIILQKPAAAAAMPRAAAA